MLFSGAALARVHNRAIAAHAVRLLRGSQMFDRVAPDLRGVIRQAEDIARQTERPLSSVHLLLAIFVTPCAAREALAEVGVDEARVMAAYRKLAVRQEPAGALQNIRASAASLGGASNADTIDSMVLLASMIRERRSLAAQALRKAQVNVAELRARLIGQVTLGVDRASSSRLRAIRPSQTEVKIVEVLDPNWVPPAGSRQRRADREAARTTGRNLQAPEQPSGGRHRADSAAGEGAVAPAPAKRQSGRAAPGPRTAQPDTPKPAQPRTAAQRPPTPATAPPRATQPRAAPPRPDGPPSVAPQSVLHRVVQRGSRPLPPDAPGTSAAPSVGAATAGRGTGPTTFDPANDATRTNAPRREWYELDPERFPTLTTLGRNLTHLAMTGEAPPLIGRDEIVDQVIEVLCMRKANNPCLVGEPGVGKTAIVEGLAARIAGDTKRFGRLGDAVIIEMHMSSLLAGTSYRGSFAERMKALRAEVAAGKGKIIVFFDEIHTMMGAGAGDGALDAANDLKTALARGRFPLIGATTREEYIQHIEKDGALDRRFQVIEVPEPTKEEAIAILSGVAPLYVEYHGIPYSHEAIASSVHLSHRFITDRQLPDKAISVLDRAGTQALRRGKTVVEADDVARAIQSATAVPMERLLADERSRIRDLGADIAEHIVGQARAIERISRRVRRNYAGFSGDRPLASFLFAGPPGTGKTATAAALARTLFLVDDALVVFDMSELSDAASASRLVGSPPGFVGHQQRGQLSEAMHRRPYRVLLFENVERAAPEIIGLLSQILATGRITDNHGRRLDMRNAVIIFTSNAGTDAIMSGAAKQVIGFAPPRPAALTEVDEGQFSEHVRAELGPEICGAVDEIVVFRPLNDEAGRAVIRRALDESAAQLFERRLIDVKIDDSVVEHLVVSGRFDPADGAFGLRALVTNHVAEFLTEQVLDGQLRPGSAVIMRSLNGRFKLSAAPASDDSQPETNTQATAPTSTDPLSRL